MPGIIIGSDSSHVVHICRPETQSAPGPFPFVRNAFQWVGLPITGNRTYARAVKYGFDPSTFQLRRIPTPDWASILRTWGTDLPEAVRMTVAEQQAALVDDHRHGVG